MRKEPNLSKRFHKCINTVFVCFVIISGVLFQCPLIKISFAEVITTITSDGTLGTQVTQNGRVYNIDGGTIKGSNLFQSFGLFSVGTGDTASFNGPNGIANIIGRVTGGQQSMIDGLLRSTIPGANLYLLNPAGVLFGQNATLDVSGSLHVSTADYLKLSDGGIFYSNPLSSSVLTTAAPAAFGFLSNPKNISVNGSFLKVLEGKTISLIGGDLNIQNGTLYVPGGTINLISVASQGETIFSGPNFNNFNVDSFEKLGMITVSDNRNDSQRLIDTEGRIIGNIDVSGNTGGNIFIRGGRFILDRGYVMADTFAEGTGIGIDLDLTEDMTLTNSALISADTEGMGHGGAISIKTPSLNIDSGSITTGTFWEGGAGSIGGDAGSIALDVGTLTLFGWGNIKTSSLGSGKGGDLTVKAPEYVFISAGNLHSIAFSTGDGGVISISTPSLVLGWYGNINTETFGGGDAGSILFDVGTLSSSGYISTSSWGSGKGGDLTVNASESVSIDSGGLWSTAMGIGDEAGDGGAISITTPSLNIESGSSIDAAGGYGDAGSIELNVGKLTLKGYISTGSDGSGKGGDITVKASKSVFIDSGALVSEAWSTGKGGIISISTPSLNIKDGDITTETYGEGDAGSIALDVGKLTLTGVAQITTSSWGSGKGGDLTINASESVFIDSGFLFSNARSTGDGGVISISTPSFLENGGYITAETIGKGDAGSIALNVGKLTLTGGSISTSSHGSGKGGDLTVKAYESVFINSNGLWSTAMSTGDGGVITIFTPSLNIEGSGTIDTGAGFLGGDAGNITLDVGTLTLKGGYISTSTMGSGKGGDLTVKASKSVFIDSGGLLSNALFSTGDGGQISISTPSLVLGNEGFIRAETIYGEGDAGSISLDVGKLTLTGGDISTTSWDSGKGGDLTVNASESVFIDSGGLFSDALSTGDGGRISIFTPSLGLENAAFVSAKSSGQGNAGNIAITITDKFLMHDSSVTTEAKHADGGNIEISANNIVNLEGSQITSSVGQGLGKGGNITIDPDFVILNGSKIIANAYGGPGGNIRIVANKVFLADPDSIVDASSTLGIDGSVDIRAPITDISGSLVPLQQNFLSAAALLRNPCEARIHGGESSSFIFGGRDGFPIIPGNVLPSPINLREYFEIESSSKGADLPERQN